MNEPARESVRSFKARAARALALFVGTLVLGPALPALLFAAAAAFDQALASANMSPAFATRTLFERALDFAFMGGGGFVALLAGLLMAGAMMARGRVGAAFALRAAALAAAIVALAVLRTPSTKAWLTLTSVFVLASMASARILYAVGVRCRVLP